MKKIIDNWEWQIEVPELLEPWFPRFYEYVKTHSVKSNAQRDVFTVESKGRQYYIKYSHPISLLQKARSIIMPKCAQEFNSSKLLEISGIPTPKTVGWAKKGPESMLMTEAVTDAVNARKYWFAIAVNDSEKRQQFLAKFADFLQKFLNCGLYHPDFHPGNLMVKTEHNDLDFILIDPYGITEMKPLSKNKIFEMLCIVGAFRGEINDSNGTALIKKIFADCSDVKCAETWHKIIIAESKKSIKLWEKRQGKILTELRYSQVFEKDGSTIRIRKTFAGELVMTLDEVLQNKDQYEIKELEHDQAEKTWISSFQKELHRLPQTLPLAWINPPGSKDIIISEKNQQTQLSKEEIKNRFQLANL